MKKYMTKQRKALLDYFIKHIDEPVTAKQVADALTDSDISLSAVYRNLAELEADNKIRRTVSPDTREACYQYSDAEECHGCLHLACEKCGRVMHIEPENSDILIKMIAKSNAFTVDRADTVIYGICSECK